MIELTVEQRHAVRQQNEFPLRALDPATQTTYVMIREETYNRVRTLFAEEDGNQFVNEMYPHAMEAIGKDGWDDPAINGYDEKAPRLPVEESELLRQINQGAPVELQQRYDALRRKRRRTKLTRKEQQELLTLTQQMEQLDVTRLQWLAQLAALRQISLPALMRQLGLEPPEPEYD
jgi:hypothetical protein